MTTTKIFAAGQHPLDCALVRTIFDFAASSSVRLYLVGGYLRDCLMLQAGANSQVKDLDFAVLDMPATDFGRMVAARLQGHYVLLDSVNDISRVVMDDGLTLDFAGCFGGSLAKDIQRRDFTINAMALDPAMPDTIIDPTGGQADLKAGLVRAVSEAGLVDDPLRLLRAYRFACVFNFDVESATREQIRSNMQRLPKVARERINYELFKMLDSSNVGRLIHEMGELALFETIFPELMATHKVTANSYHHLPLFTHSLETIPQLEARLSSFPAWAKEALDRELTPMVSRMAVTKIAAILHDIGKPDTWQITEEGRHTFIGHDKLGAEMIKSTAEAQKWPKLMARMVERLVLWHLRPGQLFHTAEPTKKALNRFYRTVGDEVPELMLLAFGDLGATRGPGLAGPQREKLESNLVALLDGYAAYKEESRRLPKLLTGSEVMKLLGIHAGPLVGEILSALAEAQALNEVQDRSQAEAFARSYLKAYQAQI